MNRLKSEEIDIGISGIRKLTEVVRQKFNFDLTMYAGTSLKRRIAALISGNGQKNLDGLIAQLESDADFFPKFQLQLGVEGTELFRDPAFWRSFRDDICKLFKNSQSKLKIWIPGCFNTEEVITTAITLKEAGLYEKAQIIATDLNQEIIDYSRNKLFQNSILELSENNYKRFKEDDTLDLSAYIRKDLKGFFFEEDLYRNICYEVIPDILHHKVKSVNMIICRNHFIYFTAQYQEKMLGAFSKALNMNGFLAIGNKENISFCKDSSKYALTNANEKIYRKNTP